MRRTPLYFEFRYIYVYTLEAHSKQTYLYNFLKVWYLATFYFDIRKLIVLKDGWRIWHEFQETTLDLCSSFQVLFITWRKVQIYKQKMAYFIVTFIIARKQPQSKCSTFILCNTINLHYKCMYVIYTIIDLIVIEYEIIQSFKYGGDIDWGASRGQYCLRYPCIQLCTRDGHI